MKRDVAALSGRFDVLVIGGGVYGAWTAYDAALRGLSVALVEKSDWASATSSASTKLIHGGLRYLEHFQFGLVRTSLDERRRLARLAPHRVTPVRFIIPVYRGGRVGLTRLRAGLWIYDLLAGGGQPVERHRALGRREMLARYPFLNGNGLRAGLSYGDCQTDDFRFALEIVDGANRAGAVTVNYAEVRELIVGRDGVCGAVVADRLGGEVTEVRASVVVNTAGAWAERLAGSELRSRTRVTKGVHLTMPALATDDAFLLTTRSDHRVFFLIPWYGRTLVGTTDTDYRGDIDGVGVGEADMDYLLDQSRRFLPEVQWDRGSICGSFAGLRVLQDDDGKPPSSLSREWVLERSRRGLLTSVGGKYTSARADAARIVDRVLGQLGRRGRRDEPTGGRPFPWCPEGDFAAWRANAIRRGLALGVDNETASSLPLRYGTAAERVHRLIERDPDLAARIVPELPFCRAEIVHGAREEMACTLVDLLRRRVPLLALARLPRAAVEEAARLAAPALGWSDEARTGQVAALLGEYGERDPVTNPSG